MIPSVDLAITGYLVLKVWYLWIVVQCSTDYNENCAPLATVINQSRKQQICSDHVYLLTTKKIAPSNIPSLPVKVYDPNSGDGGSGRGRGRGGWEHEFPSLTFVMHFEQTGIMGNHNLHTCRLF